MKKEAPPPTDARPETAGSAANHDPPAEAAKDDRSDEPEEEMGGEAPCQLHRFWDVEE
jgi:hypothetical protein